MPSGTAVPGATTRFGTLDISYSPYASLVKRGDISVSGVDVELAELNGFYALAGNTAMSWVLRTDLQIVEDIAGRFRNQRRRG